MDRGFQKELDEMKQAPKVIADVLEPDRWRLLDIWRSLKEIAKTTPKGLNL